MQAPVALTLPILRNELTENGAENRCPDDGFKNNNATIDNEFSLRIHSSRTINLSISIMGYMPNQ